MKIGMQRLKFNADAYRKINWSEELAECFQSENKASQILGNHGLVMIPLSQANSKQFTLVTPSATTQLMADELSFLENNFLNSCGLKVATVLKEKAADEVLNPDYIDICKKLSHKVLNCADTILNYTYQHLSQREAEGILLTQHEAIQLSFAAVVCQLNSAMAVLSSNVSSLEQLFLIIEYALEGLYTLSKLGGGRVLLAGNVVELIFHLKSFQLNYLQL